MKYKSHENEATSKNIFNIIITIDLRSRLRNCH